MLAQLNLQTSLSAKYHQFITIAMQINGIDRHVERSIHSATAHHQVEILRWTIRQLADDILFAGEDEGLSCRG